MVIEIKSNGQILIDGEQIGLAVNQDARGTIVYTIESPTSNTKYKEHAMPHKRYALSIDKPASGNAGRSDFDRDILALIASPAFTL